ncbi:hypothetical protein EMIT0P260_20427 [Pseudomonas sp. IT-P260]
MMSRGEVKGSEINPSGPSSPQYEGYGFDRSATFSGTSSTECIPTVSAEKRQTPRPERPAQVAPKRLDPTCSLLLKAAEHRLNRDFPKPQASTHSFGWAASSYERSFQWEVVLRLFRRRFGQACSDAVNHDLIARTQRTKAVQNLIFDGGLCSSHRVSPAEKNIHHVHANFRNCQQVSRVRSLSIVLVIALGVPFHTAYICEIVLIDSKPVALFPEPLAQSFFQGFSGYTNFWHASLYTANFLGIMMAHTTRLNTHEHYARPPYSRASPRRT